MSRLFSRSQPVPNTGGQQLQSGAAAVAQGSPGPARSRPGCNWQRSLRPGGRVDARSDSELQCAGNLNAKTPAVNVFPFLSSYSLGEAWTWGKKRTSFFICASFLCAVIH